MDHLRYVIFRDNSKLPRPSGAIADVGLIYQT